jgi:hypothetical protein
MTTPRAVPFVEFFEKSTGTRLFQGQRAYASVVFDRVQPKDLPAAERALAREMFGDVDEFPEHARNVAAMLKGARVGGSWMWSIAALWKSLTIDLQGLAPGEPAYAALIAPSMRASQHNLKYVKGVIERVPSIRRLLVGEPTSDSITLRRADGKQVIVAAFPASRGGIEQRSRSWALALMDESAFMRDSDSGVVNDQEIYRALNSRILPGGLLGVVSTAFMESGLLWDLVEENRGTADPICIAAKCPTLLMRNEPAIRQIVDNETRRDPLNAEREFDCKPFGRGASTFFDDSAIRLSADPDLPNEIEPPHAGKIFAGFDGGYTRDSTGGCVVAVAADGTIKVVATYERTPTRNSPLVPEVVCREFAEIAKRHGASVVMADHHDKESMRSYFSAAGVRLAMTPAKTEVYTRVRELLHSGKVRIPKSQKKLLRQIGEVVSEPLSGGGVRISSPRRLGDHGDLLSAWTLAVFQANPSTRKQPSLEQWKAFASSIARMAR